MKGHLEERCICPIQRQTKETNFSYIAVAGESDGTPTLSRIIVCCSGTELQAQRAYTADLQTSFRILRGSAGSGNIGSTYFSCNGPESSSWPENQGINRVSHFHSCCTVFWSFLQGSGKKVRLLILLSTFHRWLLFLRILEGHFFRNIFLRTFDTGLHWSNSCWHCQTLELPWRWSGMIYPSPPSPLFWFIF